jgi:hypothetical protein
MLLQYYIRRFSILYIIINILDKFEKEEHNVFLRGLLVIILFPDSKAKLFFVGRNNIVIDIRKWFLVSQAKSTDCCEVQADIEAYTREIITLKQGELISQEQLILQDPALAQEIIKALIDGANGIYVFLFLKIEWFC